MSGLAAGEHVAVEEALGRGERLRRRARLATAGLAAGLALVASLGLSVGAVHVPLADVWSLVWEHLADDAVGGALGPDAIVWEIRLPRVLHGALIGAGLGIVGVAIQAMVRNPLADPYVLGVSEGASAGAVAVIFLGGGAIAGGAISPAVGAFVGALTTLVLVFVLARSGGRVSSLRLLLVGVSLSYALSGLTSFFLYSTRDPAAQAAILFWILGGLGGAVWTKLPLVVATVVVGGAIIAAHARQLNGLALGDASATSLGLDPDRLRLVLLVVCSAMVAALVSVAGPIGFVGLVVPHVARLLVGADHRRVLPAATLLGAAYLVAVDIVARTLFAPAEIPIGVVTAILGTPVFLWLICRPGSSALREVA